MRKSLAFLFLVLFLTQLCPNSVFSQALKKIPKIEMPSPLELEALVLQKVNDFRKEEGLPELRRDSVLNQAAKSQAKYNYKAGKADNHQEKKNFETPIQRIHQFGGLHSFALEIDDALTMGSKIKVKGYSEKVILKTAKEVAAAFVTKWKNLKYPSKQLKDKYLYTAGIGIVTVPEENVVFATVVLANEPYIKKNDIKYSNKSYKLKPYSKELCKTFNREFGYLEELFSNSLYIKNDDIYFYFHDLNLIKSLLKKGKDGFGIDIVERSQFDCSSGNKTHPSEVQNGILLKPIKKGRLLRKNPLKENNEFLAHLGKFPSSLDSSLCELNLLVIQNNCNCETVKYNNLNSKNLRLLELDFVIDTLSITQNNDSLSRQIRFSIPFEKNKSIYNVEDIKPILDSIQLNRFNIKQIDVVAYSSIEGNAISNEVLQKKRANSILESIQQYQLQKVKTNVTTLENWEGFYNSIKDSPYYDNFKGLDKEDVRNLVNSDTLSYDLEPYLEEQRKADIKVLVESIYIDSLTPEFLPNKFEKAIKKNEYIRAKGLQSIMIAEVEKGNLAHQALFPNFVIPYTPENMPIMNNILAFKLKYDNKSNVDSLFDVLKMDVNRFLAITPKNAHLNYNRQLIELYYWSRNPHYLMIDKEAKINQPRDLFKAIKRLYNTKIDNWKVNQLLLNYHLIAADFYYETQDFKMRERSLKQVKKIILKSRLNQQQTYDIAGYFMFQIHVKWAIQIMHPFIQNGDFNEDFIFRFLSIAIYDTKQVPKLKYLKYLDMAKQLNKVRYCHLFGAPNMSFQMLEDIDIKDEYCNSCK